MGSRAGGGGPGDPGLPGQPGGAVRADGGAGAAHRTQHLQEHLAYIEGGAAWARRVAVDPGDKLVLRRGRVIAGRVRAAGERGAEGEEGGRATPPADLLG